MSHEIVILVLMEPSSTEICNLRCEKSNEDDPAVTLYKSNNPVTGMVVSTLKGVRKEVQGRRYNKTLYNDYHFQHLLEGIVSYKALIRKIYAHRRQLLGYQLS